MQEPKLSDYDISEEDYRTNKCTYLNYTGKYFIFCLIAMGVLVVFIYPVYQVIRNHESASIVIEGAILLIPPLIFVPGGIGLGIFALLDHLIYRRTHKYKCLSKYKKEKEKYDFIRKYTIANDLEWFRVQWQHENDNKFAELIKIVEEKRAEVEQQKLEQEKEEERVREKQRLERKYWTDMIGDGPKFENEIGHLFNLLGYKVILTSHSGDEGVDLYLTNHSNEKIIVQCKAHNKPIGPGPVRDLYGTLHHKNANKAIMVSLSGYSKAAKEFVYRKPIKLISITELIKYQQKITVDSTEPVDPDLPLFSR